VSRTKAIEFASKGQIVNAFEELGQSGRSLVFARLFELGAFDPILEEMKNDFELTDFDKAILRGRGIMAK